MRDCVQLLNSKIFMFPLFLNIRFVINLQMIFEPDFNFFFFFSLLTHAKAAVMFQIGCWCVLFGD